MNTDPLYEQILLRLNDVSDDKLFEHCVSDLLRDEWANLVPVPGGSDDGMDGTWFDESGPGILVSTTGKYVLRNVRNNLTQHLKKGRSKKQVIVATSQSLSTHQCKRIEKQIKDLGFKLANYPYERQSIADRLYHNSRWLKELLGLGGVAYALSRVPKGLRPLRGIQLIGRDEELRWLSDTQGDRLIVGQPGSGKTFLSQAMVNGGGALFVTDDRIDRIADGVRDQRVSAIVVEDAHLRHHLLIELMHYREASGAPFDIVAESWPGVADEVRQMLRLPKSNCCELRPLSSERIVEIVKYAGVHGPNALLHQLIRQSIGCPGRAVLLAHLCRSEKDVHDVYEGRALARWVVTTFSKLVGSRVRYLLAAFATGGDAGTSVEYVSSNLRCPIVDIYDAMAKLAHGGLVRVLKEGVLCILPETLRSALVADCFFDGPLKMQIRPFLENALDPGSACRSIIAAHARGANISSFALFEILQEFGDRQAWEHFVWSSEENARLAARSHPELIARFATAYLERAPDLVLAQLLSDAIEDNRTLHNHLDHPLRMIEDWVKASLPNTGQAFERRSVLWTSMQKWCANGGNVQVCFRAIRSVVCPEYRGSEQDPGDKRKFHMRFGRVATADLDAIATLWPEVLRWCGDRVIELAQWDELFEALDDWIFPGRFGGSSSEEQDRIFRATAQSVVESFSKLAIGRPGVLSVLRNKASYFGITLAVEVDADFEILFPEEAFHDPRGWEAARKEQAERGRQLAATWLNGSPTALARKLVWCAREGALHARTLTDYSRWFCLILAEGLADARPWLAAMISEEAPADHIAPFLDQVIKQRDEGWLQLLLDCSRKPDLAGSSLAIFLTLPEQEQVLEEEMSRNLIGRSGIITNDIHAGAIPMFRLSRLLKSDDDAILTAVVDRIWQRRNEVAIPGQLTSEWRSAVVRSSIDDYWLGEMFAVDAELAYMWLHDRVTREPTAYRGREPATDDAVSVLSIEQRRSLLEAASDDVYSAEGIVTKLVGDSAELYRHLLGCRKTKRIHLAPLSEDIDDAWVRLAICALDVGYTPASLANVAATSLDMEFDEVPRKYEQRSDVWQKLLDHEDRRIRQIAQIGEMRCQSAIREWQREEERDDL